MKKLYALAALILLTAFSGYAQNAPTVMVRAGIHDRYNRLVFDWTKPVKYDMQQQANGLVRIQFNVQATANFKSVTAVNPPFIRDLAQENTPNGLLVTFRIPDQARVQAFWSGQKVAFDVLRMSKDALKFSTESPPAVEAQKPVQTQGPLDATVETPPPQEKVAAPAPESEKQTAKEETTISIPTTPQPSNAPKSENPLHKLRTLADALAKKPSDSFLQKPQSVQTPDDKTPGIVKGTVIRLKTEKLSRLAAFQRSGKLWLVVDQAQKNLMPKVEGDLASSLTNAKRITSKNVTAFVFDFDRDDVVFSIRRNGPEWNIWMNPAEKPLMPPAIPLNITDDKGKQPRVVLYAGEQPVVINLKDTSLGDRLWIVPVRSPEGLITQKRQTPSYTMLPTLMGAVIIPQDDQLRIGTLNDLVVLSAADGNKLLLSTEKDRRYGKGEEKASQAFRLDIPLKESKGKNFAAQRQEIEKKLSEQQTDERKAAVLLDMARLYLQYGFGPEADGLLRIAKKQSPTVEAENEYRALRGLAAALSGKRKQAEDDLTSDALHSLPEAAVWLGYARARDNDWQNARAAFAESGDAEKTFPSVLRNRLILAKAETALAADDIITAQAELKKLPDIKELSPAEKAAHDYIRATTYAVLKHNEDAVDLYKEVADGADQMYRAKAELNLVRQLVATKKMKLPEAIERLERLRYAWRGDRFEIDVLRQLGQYYIDGKQYFEGLTLWRQAAGLSKNTDDTDRITQNMQDVFRKLYVDGEADKLPPLQALSLYDRFRELTPTGDDGDIALRRLADRLAAVDLFDQADPLMEDQALKKAQGEEAAVLGAKLAGWRLLNRNAPGALKILDQTETQDTLSDTLRTRRMLLRARALADTGKVDEALALLKNEQSNEGLSLKADISWRQARWSEAIVALQALASNYRNQGKTAVDGPIPGVVLKMAIGLSLDENKKGLELLIAEYGDYMAKTPKAKAFDLITKPSRGSALADLDTLKGQVGEVELFQQFLKNFGS